MIDGLSIVTTYRNRKHHMEKTIPTWISPNTPMQYEIIFVDYGINQDEDLPSFFRTLDLRDVLLRHVQCLYLKEFCLSHARNVGANVALGEWVLFIDIDTCLSEGSICEIYKYLKDKECYYAAVDSQVRKDIINGGLILVRKESHIDVCGFNESIRGWGFEDIDYKQRLEKQSHLQWNRFSSDLYRCIDHGDEERTRHYSADKEISWTKNRQIALNTWSSDVFGQWEYCLTTTYGE